MKTLAATPWALLAALSLEGCSGPQSALDPAGDGADRIARLFWWMTIGTVIVWTAVAALTAWALMRRRHNDDDRKVRMLIVGGGAVIPTVILAVLLVYGLGMMPPMLARAPEGSLRIVVSGEQWWWRVRYLPPNGGEAVLANEIRMAVGEPVEFELESPDVIHSFWIPSLGGKMDMIPGRRTRLVLHPRRTGTFRGVCAEYCGGSHALMAFPVVVMEKPASEQWLAEQSAPAREPADPMAVRGRELFALNGCSACHAVRGTDANGVVGPDLTHVGSRLTLGAGILPNDPEAFVKWIAHTDQVKPSVLMPHFRMLPREELQALAAYLESLQ
jgi:cytochrome c oxidase subunit 2